MNDLHGAVETSATQNLARTATYLKNQKAANPDTLIIANGDMFQGTALSNYFLGQPVVDFMNEVGFDQLNVGNHEFDWGIDFLDRYWDGDLTNGEADFPLVSANIVHKTTRKPLTYSSPYSIVELPHIKVGIIGVIGSTLTSSISYSRVADYEFLDQVTTVAKYAKELRTQQSVDFVIVNIHLQGDASNRSLASLVGDERIDLIINGHTHIQEREKITHSSGYEIPSSIWTKIILVFRFLLVF
jgi:2',3'-cyclic-nucleotide 2'-phosphodiesterase/3'-nucleotidase